jgi:hypothetical protein
MKTYFTPAIYHISVYGCLGPVTVSIRVTVETFTRGFINLHLGLVGKICKKKGESVA